MEPAIGLSDNSILSTSGQQQDANHVRLANSILSQLHVPKKIKHISEINGSLFVTMYEGLCGEQLPDVIRLPKSMEDEIHNAQCVIDALSLEVLHTSLSHIQGEAIGRGDKSSIANLLDLFSSLMEFILNRIECDLSTDGEDLDADCITSDIVDDILSRDLDAGLDLDDNDNIPPENSTMEIVRESEEVERQMKLEDERKKMELERKLEEEEEERQREIDRRLRDEELGREIDRERFEREQLAREREQLVREKDQLARDILEGEERIERGRMLEDKLKDKFTERTEEDISLESSGTLPALDSSPSVRQADVTGGSLTPSKHHYSSLLSLTEETSDLVRSAVRNSPARAKAERSAFLEAAIKSALKKINREAEGVQKLVGDLPKRKCVRLKLSDEFAVDIPRQSPVREPLPQRPEPLSANNNANLSDEEVEVAKGKKKPVRKVQPVKKRVDDLKRMYRQDYENIAKEQQKLTDEERSRARAVDRSLRQQTQVSRPPAGSQSCRKPPRRLGAKSRRHSASASPPRQRSKREAILDDPDKCDLFTILEAFPSIHLSTDTLHDLWRKSMRQIEQLNNIERQSLRKDQLHKQLQDAARRQHLVSEIFRKDMEHRQRMGQIKERRVQQRSVQKGLQDKRAQSARIRKYYEEFQLGMRSKMLNKRIKEELIFKKVFKDGLAIQRDCIRDMRKYAKEQRSKRGQAQQDEIDSLENFYRDQFALLAEAMEEERQDSAQRQHAQSKVIERMKRELRLKMEQDIRTIQSQLVDSDDQHFRELDADRLHQDLMLTKCKPVV